jgi:hypothetical protein
MTIEESFKDELKQLLAKYKATLSASDHYSGWPECGEDVRITVELNDNPYEIDLGKYFP